MKKILVIGRILSLVLCGWNVQDFVKNGEPRDAALAVVFGLLFISDSMEIHINNRYHGG